MDKLEELKALRKRIDILRKGAQDLDKWQCIDPSLRMDAAILASNAYSELAKLTNLVDREQSREEARRYAKEELR